MYICSLCPSIEPKGSGAWRLFTLHGAVHETDPELPRLYPKRADLAAAEDAELPGPLTGSLHRPDKGRQVEPVLTVIAEDGVSRFEADCLRLTARNVLGGHQARRDRMAVDTVMRDVEHGPLVIVFHHGLCVPQIGVQHRLILGIKKAFLGDPLLIIPEIDDLGEAPPIVAIPKRRSDESAAIVVFLVHPGAAKNRSDPVVDERGLDRSAGLVEIGLLGPVAALVVAGGEPGVAVLVPRGPALLVEIGLLDLIAALGVLGPPPGVAVLVPRGPALLVEIGLLDLIAALVVLGHPPGVAVLVPRGPALLVEVGLFGPVAALLVADIISGVAGGGVEAPAGLLDQFAPLIVPLWSRQCSRCCCRRAGLARRNRPARSD